LDIACAWGGEKGACMRANAPTPDSPSQAGANNHEAHGDVGDKVGNETEANARDDEWQRAVA